MSKTIGMGTKLRKKLRLFLTHVETTNFYTNTHAMVSQKAIVGLGVSFLLVAIVIPLGMTQLVAANTTGWDAAVVTVFTVLLPVLVIIGLAIKYIPGSRK